MFKEQRETVPQSRDIVNIFNGRYQFHWTTSEKLPKILSQGIFSPEFAHRIKDERFEGKEGSRIWAMKSPQSIFMVISNIDKIVGIAINVPPVERYWGTLRIRVSPKKFVGLVMADTLALKRISYQGIPGERRVGRDMIEETRMEEFLERIEQCKKLMESNGVKTGSLPIYGTSGNLYSPVRLNYRDLKQGLTAK